MSLALIVFRSEGLGHFGPLVTGELGEPMGDLSPRAKKFRDVGLGEDMANDSDAKSLLPNEHAHFSIFLSLSK